MNLTLVSAVLAAASAVAALAALAARPGRTARAAALLRRYGSRQPDRQGALLGWTARLLKAGNRQNRIAARLAAAGISRTPAEWSLAWAVAGLAVTAAVALTGHLAAGAVAGVITSAAGPRATVNVRASRRRARFDAQLPGLLQVAAGSLRAGMSLPQAIGRTAAEAPQPAAAELGRAVAETRIGAGLADALDGVADRMRSRDLHWAVIAIRTCQGIGGNLAEILDVTAATMADRASMRSHARALSAEGRLSGRILVALPVLIGAWLFATDRSYMAPMYSTPAGIIMSAAAVLLIIAGALWMRSAAKVRA